MSYIPGQLVLAPLPNAAGPGKAKIRRVSQPLPWGPALAPAGQRTVYWVEFEDWCFFGAVPLGRWVSEDLLKPRVVA